MKETSLQYPDSDREIDAIYWGLCPLLSRDYIREDGWIHFPDLVPLEGLVLTVYGTEEQDWHWSEGSWVPGRGL